MLHLDGGKKTREKSSKKPQGPGEIDRAFFLSIGLFSSPTDKKNFRLVQSIHFRQKLSFHSARSTPLILVPMLTRRSEAGDARAGSRAGDGGHVDFSKFGEKEEEEEREEEGKRKEKKSESENKSFHRRFSCERDFSSSEETSTSTSSTASPQTSKKKKHRITKPEPAFGRNEKRNRQEITGPRRRST